MEALKTISLILALPLRFLIWGYQKTISPDHGVFRGLYPYGYCKFYPSCSEYAAVVLRDQGVVGLPKIIYRISKCRPGVNPAIDRP